MKKIIAVLVAAALMLTGISAFAAGTPAEEGAVYRALINAGFDQPDYVVRHFDSVAALTTDELAAIDTYFAAIDDAVKVAVTNVDQNLAGSQLVTMFANLNAIAKILKISYKINVEVPTAVEVKAAAEDADTDYIASITETKMVYLPINQIINAGIIAVVEGTYADLAEDAAADVLAEDETYALTEYDLSDFDLNISIFCEENGVCVSNGGALSTIYSDLSITAVTGRDDMYAAKSGVRSLFANLQKVVKAVAAYKPAAAAPATSAPANGSDRLPDTATSYGNLVVLGVVMMVVAAAAVIGIKKVAIN